MKLKYAKILTALLFAVSSTLAVLAQGEYVKFEIKNAGISVEGEFEKFDANLAYDSANPNNSTFSAKIDAASINTGIELRDEHLTEKEEFFNVEKYPSLTFESTRSALLTNGKIKVEGNLTIKNVTKSVTLIATPITSGSVTYFETELKLDRLDYNVGESSWMMADEVICKIRAAAN